jgi:Histidine kinase-, DNA gyrase B-, and HSP90-like ATPase
MLSSRTFGARTLASPVCWAIRQQQPSAWLIQFCALALLTVFVIPLSALSSSASEGQPKEKHVLVLFSAIPFSQAVLDVVEPTIRARVPGSITFNTAYLEDPQIEERSYRESVSETLRRRYAKVKLDVVIVSNQAALHFAVEYRDKIFPGVPIVFVAVGAGDLDKQKALHNSVKYSGAKCFEVHLQGKPGELDLEVSDAGVGFDAVNLKGKGLGMVSMQERINFVGGHFSVQSRVGEGTRIIVSVPLVESQESSKIND